MGNKRLWALTGVALAVLSAQGAPLAQTPAPAPAAASAPAAPAEQAAFAPEQIEQMVAPIALYPDALLAQVFMAATYPLEVVQAARWVKKNEALQGEALDAALRDQPWDPSVKTLAMFPTVLQRMNDNLDWTQDLGDAFLAQEQEVMDTVQRLRQEAQKTGALKDTPQQKVVVEKETIVVEPADPQTVYVPTYDPSVVYGQPPPAQPYYPTVYQQPVATTTTDPWVSFGAGALVGGLLTAAIMWDDDDDWDGYHVWHHGPGYWDNDWPGPRYGSNNWNSWRGDTNINGDVCVGRCTSIDRDQWKRQANNFQHNPVHRGGVKYRDGAQVAARHPEVNRPRQPGGIDRDTARGKARPTTLPAQTRPGDRPQVGTGDRRPGGTTTPGDRPQLGGGDRERPGAGARPAERPQVGGGDRPGAGAKPAERPKVASADRPKADARPAQRPQAESRPAQRPQQQFKAPERSVSQASKASRPTAFQSSGGGGSFERQASARGASSRGSGGMKGSGGSGARGGGGGARGGGGGGRGGGGRGR